MIYINNTIRIVRQDELNLELQEYRKKIIPKTKEEKYDWCRVGYYGSLSTAIRGVFKKFCKELAEENLLGWAYVLARIEQIYKELKEVIQNKCDILK